ncbi:MAG: sulfatase-like hydrolase/transferase [Rhodoferax sp.]|nr:sulfatase-like hydrolase/transferase [Rhodoferax sp.]MCB2008351.1 sulfatase-like hydrolase/transferase [Rhodoferax sp.]MCB2030040.1 sulfatase-like hydrolase/transferase [Rhodoferax sp.]MCB2043938.1 sulfatase-like hydrolase/transferase [Rhodoferax sp.]
MPTNFLIFIVDQLNAGHLGCYGSPLGATPRIDALAGAGWRATDCHVATPICMPNRASLLTGRMPSAHGVRHNGIALSLAARTCVDLFRAAGYRTALLGKSHLQNMTAKPPLPAVQPASGQADAERAYPGHYQQECAQTWSREPDFQVHAPYYGFDHVELVIGHGDTAQGHYRRWLQQAHPDLAARCGPEHALPAPDYELTRTGQAWRTRLPEQCHPTAWTADRTIQQLQQAAQAGQPFFTYCSFADPHHPYTPPGRFWDRYQPQDMELPATFHSEASAPHLQWLRAQRDQGQAVKNTMACYAATERETREALALGHGSLAFIDQQVGRVLDALDALDLTRDTVVIFTSDHGEFAGDHQLLFKGSLHYPSLTRTPVIWRDGAGGSQACEDGSLLSTIDIAPTLLERAGLQAYCGMQGKSFLASLGGKPDRPRESLLIEEEGQRVYFGLDRPVRMRTLLTARHRLSIFDGASWGELYDRLDDPGQSRNLWDDPGSRALRDGLMAQLAYEMLAATDSSPAPTAIA